MLLRTKLFALAISLVLAAVPAGAESAYLADIDDLPLAGGLVEDPAARVVFDKPAGRIVEAVARGPVTADAVREFYAQTLPALGWQAAPGGTWVRGEEQLKIEIGPAGPPVAVRFSIAPRDQ